ncbi:hypothetical protein [Pseudomonas viridiflava]|uniref:hypothetical protein n=1 Tax=Pseudomonas viridiflava TaxID=33069 RepID=UPI001F086160|nr:hypothetical protein [Pseudomonas viridiflava]
MAYLFLSDFIVEFGFGVGEFLSDYEKAEFSSLSLEQVVRKYVDERNFLSVFFLGRQIRKYIKENMSSEGLEYTDPPFGEDMSFVEDYFDGDLYVFLTTVSALLDENVRAHRRRIFSILLGKNWRS